MHLNDDELIELFYGDAEVSSRRHLLDCEECRERSKELSAFLSGIGDDAVPEPDENFERDLWSRLDEQLPERHVSRPNRWVWVAAAAALLLLTSSLLLNRPVTTAPGDLAEETSLEVGDGDRDRMLMLVILRHLDQSERVVVELSNTETAEIAEVQRSAAEDLLERNRLFRQSAELAGNQAAAKLLDELELVLLETARGEPEAGSVRSIRDLIGEGELLFKMNVLRNEIQQGTWAARNPAV